MSNTIRTTNTATLSNGLKDELQSILIDIITTEHKKESAIIDSDDRLSAHEKIQAYRESSLIWIGAICGLAIITSLMQK